jgi:hypothetical protein
MAWLLPAVGVVFALMPSTDLAYLIRVGDLMADAGSVLRSDTLTYTAAGMPWVNQQWGSSLVLAKGYALAGWPGLVVLRAALVSVCFGVTYRRARTVGADPMVCGVLVLVGFICAATLPGSLALRPQLLVAPLFVLSSWILARRVAHPWGLAALPIVGIAWANLHGSFVLLPVVLAIAFVGDLVARRRLAWATGSLTLVTLATPIVSPWGPRIYGYLADLISSPVVRVIDEWRPAVLRFPAGIVFVLACIGGAVALWRRAERRPTAEESLGILVFTVLAAASGRNILWWALYVPPIAAVLLRSWRPSSSASVRAGRAVAAGLVVLVALGLWRVVRTDPDERLLGDAPPGITAALADTAGDHRIFAADWPGWFEFALPGVPMFVDPRVELFPEHVWDQYFQVVTGDASWRDVLDGWDVDTVVVDPSMHPALDAAIGLDPAWRRTYADDDGAIYERVPG